MKTRLISVLLMALFTTLFACKKSEITPTVIAVQEVTMTPTTASLVVGGTTQLIAAVAPAGATNKAVSWTSDKKEIATVDAKGVVTAVAAGTATITAISNADGTKTATCAVTVTAEEVKVSGVQMGKSTTTILVGGKERLVATVAPENATNKGITWSSDKKEIATVDDKGEVTAVAEGKATITVTSIADGTKLATCAVTVTAEVVAVESVTLDKTTANLEEGDKLTLVATVAPAEATNKNVTWTTSDDAVAKVVDGKVTALKAGKATITATTEEGGHKATCAVTVTAEVVAVESVSLNPTAKIEVGGTFQLVATVAPAEATNKNVTWTTSDNNIATVDVNGSVTAKTIGTATITVTTEEGGHKATCAVEVVALVDHVVIGNLKWAKGNLVAKNSNECQVGAPTDNGLYFQFGSLVGWSGGANGDGTGTGSSVELALKVTPLRYNDSPTWTTAGRYMDGTTDTKGCDLPSTDDPIRGIGDPCRYYLGGTWRTPTATEYEALVAAGDGGWVTSPPKGRWFGPEPSDASRSVFFPASGYRDREAGAIGKVGFDGGEYWSSSVYNAAGGYALAFGDSSVTPQSPTNRPSGMPARCVSPVV